MAELWPKSRRRDGVPHHDWGLKVAIKWSNLNIFQWDQVYMLDTHKRNILSEYEVKWSINVALRA